MGRKPTVNLNVPKGMRVRVRRGTSYFYLDLGGKPRREMALGPDYAEALRKWAELSKSQATGKITVQHVITSYKANREFEALGSGTKKDYTYAMDKIVEHFGDAPITAVKPEYLRLYMDKRSAVSEHRALREVAVFGTIFRFAIERGWATFNPVSAVRRKRLEGRKKVYITDDMLDLVYSKAEQDLKDAMDLAYYTGQRPGDLLTLSENNLSGSTLEYRQNKTDVPQRIALSGGLLELVERIRLRKKSVNSKAPHLLVDERGKQMTKAKLRSRFEKARADAGISGAEFQFRDLRSKAGSDLKDQAGIESARTLLGHTSVTMTEHYTNRRRGELITQLPVRGSGTAGESDGNCNPVS